MCFIFFIIFNLMRKIDVEFPCFLLTFIFFHATTYFYVWKQNYINIISSCLLFEIDSEKPSSSHKVSKLYFVF